MQCRMTASYDGKTNWLAESATGVAVQVMQYGKKLAAQQVLKSTCGAAIRSPLL
jgi:hypothetical protein